MLALVCFIVCTLLLTLSQGLRLELNLHENGGPFSKVIRVVVQCDSLAKKPADQKDSWHDSNLESPDSSTKGGDFKFFIPDITVNAPKHYKCFLLTPNLDIPHEQLRKRVHRELAVSVPGEFGTCQPGYRFEQDRCFPCPRGSYSSGEVAKCLPCPLNSFNDREAAASCSSCPEGRKTLIEGSDTENLCIPCKPGYRLSEDRCFPCPPGSYSSGEVPKCLPCPRNYFNRNQAADSCFVCPGGQKTLAEGADSDELCVQIDASGQPETGMSTKTIVILICVLIFVICVWIAIIIWFYWWRRRDQGKYVGLKQNEEEMGHLVDKSEEHFYESISDMGSDEDHIYAEIGDFDTTYEVPIKPNQDQFYTDLIPEEAYYDEVADSDEHIYEEPISLKPKALSHDSFYGMNHATSKTLNVEPLDESVIRKEYVVNNHHEALNHVPPHKKKKESDIRKLASIIVHGSKSDINKKMKESERKKSVAKEKDVEKLTLLLNNILKKVRLADSAAMEPTEPTEVQSEPAMDTPRLKAGRKVKSDETETAKPSKKFGLKLRIPKNKTDKTEIKEAELIPSSTADVDTSSNSSNILDVPNLPEIIDSKIFLGDLGQ